MPVSKKPRRKTTASSSKAGPVRTMPDRRTMESFLATLSGQRTNDAADQAQDLVYQAYEEASPARRIALAHKALSISPLCADALNLLAEAASSPAEARDLYAKAVEAATVSLGPKGFEEYAGHFWGFLETRPYMRARAGLAAALQRLGDEDGAIAHYREMLELNPNDNQGIRYVLAACLLRRNEDAALQELLAAYPGEASTPWLYTRALLAFREGGAKSKQAIKLAAEAWGRNQHVPAILARRKQPVSSQSGYITMGEADEASDYIAECGPAWHATPGAVDWLTSATAGLTPRKTPTH